MSARTIGLGLCLLACGGASVSAQRATPRPVPKQERERTPATAAGQRPAAKPSPATGLEVTLSGRVRDGIVAIGGEHTGTELQAGKIRWELDFDKPDLRQAVKKYADAAVEVHGRLKRVTGTERRDRQIIVVDRVTATRAIGPADAPVKVSCVGQLRYGVVAIGGETTGTTISGDGTTWELDLSRSRDLASHAATLNRKTVAVEGTLEMIKGIERQTRWVVSVNRLEKAE